MSKLTTITSYIIPPDTPGFIRVTSGQLNRLIAANLVKQIGTTKAPSDEYEPIMGLPEVQVKRPVYGVPDGGRVAMFRCYLID